MGSKQSTRGYRMWPCGCAHAAAARDALMDTCRTLSDLLLFVVCPVPRVFFSHDEC